MAETLQRAFDRWPTRKPRGPVWAAYLRQTNDNPDGLVDQLDCVIEVAKRYGGGISADDVFFDIASGCAQQRPGLLELLVDVRSGRYGAVVVEDLARLSRSQAHMGELLSELRHHDVRLIHG